MSPVRGRSRWAVLAATMVVVLAACNSTTSSTAPSVAASVPAASTAPAASASAAASQAAGASAVPTPVTGIACAADAKVVKFWTSHTPPDSDVLAKIVEAFNAANKDICVKMTIVPGTETDVAKLLTAIRGGVAPDVYMADRFTVPQRAAEGVLAALPDAVAGTASQYLPFAWAETQFQGKTYALQFDTDARALWYNIDLIKAAGQDPAQLDIAKGAPTIDTVNKIADAISKKDASGNYTTMGWMPAVPVPAATPVPSTRAGTTRGASTTVASSPISPPARSPRRIRAWSRATSSCMTGPRPTIRRPWPGGSRPTCPPIRPPPRTRSGPASLV